MVILINNIYLIITIITGNKSTHNIVMYMFTALSIKTKETNNTLWEELSPASPNSCRVLSLLLGKESEACLKNLYKTLINKRVELQSSPISILYKGRVLKFYIIFKMSMIDHKLRQMLSGQGGAFCILCTCSREDAVCLLYSFTINKTSAQITEIWNKLSSGQLKKRPHDQDVRMGVTRESLIDLESIASISPLHALLRFFDFLLKIIYHLNANIFNWSEEKKVLGDEKYSQLQITKNYVRALLKEKTNISVDMPDATGKGGTSTNGNVVHSLLSKEKNLEVMVSAVPEKFQKALHECLTRCYVILKLYNSMHKINVDSFKTFCVETKKCLLTSFNENEHNWIYFTPTVHAVLDHSGDLIESNYCTGLGAYTESSLECNNKILRLIRIALSRKTNQVDNLNDCLNRMWVRSDIHVRSAVSEKRHFRRSETTEYRFQGPLPLVTLADHYIRDLVVE